MHVVHMLIMVRHDARAKAAKDPERERESKPSTKTLSCAQLSDKLRNSKFTGHYMESITITTFSFICQYVFSVRVSVERNCRRSRRRGLPQSVPERENAKKKDVRNAERTAWRHRHQHHPSWKERG